MFDWLWRMVSSDMDKAIATAQNTAGAKIIDVRTAAEVAEGVVPGAIWIPMDRLSELSQRVPEKDTPLFVYCKGGVRAARAIKEFEAQGYTQLTNAGGVVRYHGKLVPLS